MASFARWNRQANTIEVDLPGAPAQQKISITVGFNGSKSIKQLLISRYTNSSTSPGTTVVAGFHSCATTSTMTQVNAGSSASCNNIPGPARSFEPDIIILAPGYQDTDCTQIGTTYTPFSYWQTKETYFVEQPGGSNRETSIWELTGSQAGETIIITIVIEDNAGGGPAGGGSELPK
jgi:hypothetical protein